MRYPIVPISITFYEWACQLNPLLPHLTVPRPQKGQHWRKWAEKLICANQQLIGTTPIPTSIIYPLEEDWKRWAAYFMQSTANI